MDKLTPRAVIFDLGSTLIEYESVPWKELIYECTGRGWEFLLKEKSGVPSEKEFRKLFGAIIGDYRKTAVSTLKEWNVETAVSVLFERLGVENSKNLSERFFDAFYEPVARSLFVYEDTVDVLESVKERYERTGLVSNTIFPARAHLSELARFKLKPYLGFTIFSSEFGLRKPHPHIFLEASRLADCKPSECVYVGDRYEEDVKGPLSTGMTPILRLHCKREYPEDMPDSLRTIERLSDLEDHILI